MRHISDDLLRQLLAAARAQLGLDGAHLSEWRHSATDTVYVVEDVVVEEDSLRVLVTYGRRAQGVRWARPMASFLEKFEKIVVQ